MCCIPPAGGCPLPAENDGTWLGIEEIRAELPLVPRSSDMGASQVLLVLKNLPATRVRSLGRSPGEGNGNPLQDSCLEKLTDRRAWWAAVRGVAESQTRVSAHTHTHTSDTGPFLPILGSVPLRFSSSSGRKTLMFTKVVKGDKGVWERELDSAQTRRDRVSSFAGVTRSFSECVCVCVCTHVCVLPPLPALSQVLHVMCA